MTSASTPPGATDTLSRLTLQWRTVAAGSLFFTLAAVIGLVVIATTKNADTLSTIALVLAIIAFIAQLMIFVAQTGAAATQERRSADISATTLGLLAEIRATSAGSDQLLRDQFGMIVRQLMRTAIPRSVREAATESKKEFDPEEFQRSVVRRIEDYLRTQLGNAYPDVQPNEREEIDESRGSALSAEARGQLALLQSWPERDTASSAHAELSRLAPMCLVQFQKLAEDYKFSLQIDVDPGLYGDDDSLIAEELVGLGLVERFDYVPPDRADTSKYRYTLSNHGLEVARLLTAPFNEMPRYVKELDLSTQGRLQ